MKKVDLIHSGLLKLRFSFFLLCAFISFASCSNLTVEDCASNSSNQNLSATGTLTVLGSESVISSRALNVSDISFAKVEVSGTGIAVPLVAESTVVLGKGNATVSNIPVGKNRVVTVYAYDSENKKLGTVLLRAVTDIKSGENSVVVNNNSTALGNVFNELLSNGYDLSKISDAQKSELESKIDSSKSWALIDSASISADFSNNTLKEKIYYILESGNVSIINNYATCSVQIGDPVSSVAETLSSGTTVIENVAPGTWPVYVTKADGKIEKSFVTVRAGQTSSITLGKVSDRIIVHYKGNYSNIYAWVSETEKLFGNWPGKAMEDSDGDGWKDVVIEKTSCKLIFQ